ncbi:hypothetical protein [Mesorhizobium sp. ESP-6-2]|uniref:hypothetical protein n=1 Tax=Mesorhizobium sp. ESP-6-2 TaxID=2876625 RepID=UPI001CCBE819|nr:hypothetical protein [Mesorhizobium sp. ESP-6-2]MBZ9807657.1 hypothetical protein [Mesorhizobium sp. ESP-6-2]
MNFAAYAQIITPTLENHADWRAGSGAGGKRPFHVHRHPSDAGGESLLDVAGRPARFATLEAAVRASRRANLAQVQ